MKSHVIKESWLNDEGKVITNLEYNLQTCGESPPLTEPQKEEILTAHKIHCGKVSKCSVCGHSIPDGSCAACLNCGNSFGQCG